MAKEEVKPRPHCVKCGASMSTMGYCDKCANR